MLAPLKGSAAEPSTRLLASLASLVASAESSAQARGAAARLDQATRRWSLEVPTPADVVTLVAELRGARPTSRRREALLDRIALVAVTAVAERQVREALTDPLTGLATRARLEEDAQHLLAVSVRDGSTLTAVVLDVDGLKQINDEQGHAAGDAAIAEVGRAIRQHVRRTDRAFRWGGDEFVLLMPSTTEQGARLVVERIQQSCATPTSAGVATHQGGCDPVDLVAWLSSADADLYRTRGAARSASPRAVVLPFHHASRAALIGVAVGAAAIGGLGVTTVASTFGIGGSHPRTAVAAAPAAVGSGVVELLEHPASRPATTAVTPTHLTPVQAPVVHRAVVAKPKPVAHDLLPDVPAVVPHVPSTPTVPSVPVEPAGPPAPQSLVQQLVRVVNVTLGAIRL